MTDLTTKAEGKDLFLSCVLDASPARVYQAWTDPALLAQWFAPAPLTTANAELDVRPGGSNLITMRTPEGQEFPSRGVYLEVVPNQRLVFTDALAAPGELAENPFMLAELTFSPHPNGGTAYQVRVNHRSVADREKHEQMGFHQGWSQCAQQLAAIVESSPADHS